MGCEGTAGTALDLLFHMASPLQRPTRQVLYVLVTDKLLQVSRNCVGVGGGEEGRIFDPRKSPV